MSKILLGVVLLSSGCALASPPSTKFTVHVTDCETGKPITDALVKTGFRQKADPWGLGVGKSNRVEKQLNEEGKATFEGKSIYGERGGTVFADGYYNQRLSLKCKKNLVLNRWEPWNPTFEVKMRPKKNPVPMVQEGVDSLKIPVWDAPIGFDLEKGDWVTPHGKGKQSDFFVNMYRRFEHSSDYDAVAKITFPNDRDGIQLYSIPEEFQRSGYKFPYEAPSDNYQDKLVLERHATLRTTKCSFNPKTDKYIFRVRTKMDEDGNIVSACYGRTGRIEIGWGEVLDTTYYFNAVPNERSLEYNGKNLLKK